MILIIKQNETGNIHEVNQFLRMPDGTRFATAESWPGWHVVGIDCELIPMTQEEWDWIVYIRGNEELTIRQIAKLLKAKYCKIYRMVQAYNLTVKMERKRGEVKKKEYWAKK